MVGLTALWLPIVVSAALVFVGSSIIHMALTYHRTDFKELPVEGAVREALRGTAPGDYYIPYAVTPKAMAEPEMIKKFEEGPVGSLTVLPNGPPVLPKFLGMWMAYCLVVSFVVAYLTGRSLAAGTEYLTVFRLSGTAAFLAYSGGHAIDSIWKGQGWVRTFKDIVDGLVYALLTAGAFAWLWPA